MTSHATSTHEEHALRGHGHAPAEKPETPEKAPTPLYRPQGDRILLRPESPPEKIGLIILAAATRSALKAQIDRGEVLAMGPGMLTVKGERWPMPEVSVGETLIFFVEGGQQVKIGEETFLSIRDDFAIAVLEKDGSIRPLGSRFAVRPSKAEEKSLGGILYPQASWNPPLEGKVVAVGKGRRRLRSELTWHTGSAQHQVLCLGRVVEDKGYSRVTTECTHASHFAPEEIAPCHRKLGETVLFGPGLGIEIKHDGETLRILSEGDLLGVRE